MLQLIKYSWAKSTTSQLRGWLIRHFSISFHEPRSPPFVAALRESLNCTLTYTIPKKHVLRVEFWLHRFPWPPGHIPPVQVLRRAFLPILALRPSWVGRRVDVWRTTIHVFCLLPFPSPQPLEVSPAWSACLVQQWHSHLPYSSHQKGGLRTPHRKQLPFPAFLSLFTFHSSLDRSSFSFPYGFGSLNFSRHSCFQFFSECPIPATIISTTVHTCWALSWTCVLPPKPLWGKVLLVALFYRWIDWDRVYREFTYFAQGYIANKWQNEDSEPDLSRR